MKIGSSSESGWDRIAIEGTILSLLALKKKVLCVRGCERLIVFLPAFAGLVKKEEEERDNGYDPFVVDTTNLIFNMGS